MSSESGFYESPKVEYLSREVAYILDILEDIDKSKTLASTIKLRAVIDAAKSVRDSLKEYDEDEYGSGEIFYCEMMSESVDLLVEAINEHEESIDE